MRKTKDEVRILLGAEVVSGSSQQIRLLRRWNRLSRLQKTLVYTIILAIIFLVNLLFLGHHSNEINFKKKLNRATVTSVTNISQPASELQVSFVRSTFSLEDVLRGPKNDRQEAVVKSFLHAWKNYKKYAWGYDNLKPLSSSGTNWFGLGLTIIDSLDTALMMGLKDEYKEGRDWVAKELVFTKHKDVNLFEVTIRVLGALLTNYHLSNDTMFLDKAIDLGDRLLGAFTTKSGIPYSDVNLATKLGHSPSWSYYSSTAEVTTLQVEFRELSRSSGIPIYEQVAATVSEKIHELPKKDGLVPIFINPNTGLFSSHGMITLGARGDSYYEYLLKQWIQTGKTKDFLRDDYIMAMEGVRDRLAKHSQPNKYLFIGEMGNSMDSFSPKMDHLVCFLPGTLALGYAHGMPEWHLKMAQELLFTCYMTYNVHPTHLAPEITHFNTNPNSVKDMYTKRLDSHNLLRPEFVESLWYLYEVTGNRTYQQWGWDVFQAFERHAKVENGYTSLTSVQVLDAPRTDNMESFFLSETLKYFYLLFSENRNIIDLHKLVMNTEAHPLPIYSS